MSSPYREPSAPDPGARIPPPAFTRVFVRPKTITFDSSAPTPRNFAHALFRDIPELKLVEVLQLEPGFGRVAFRTYPGLRQDDPRLRVVLEEWVPCYVATEYLGAARGLGPGPFGFLLELAGVAVAIGVLCTILSIVLRGCR